MAPQAIVVALLVLGLAALVVWLVRWSQRLAARMHAGWMEAARLLAGTFTPKSGPWYARTALIEGRVGGSSVRIDHYVVSTGKTSQTYTRARTEAVAAGALQLRVHPRHALSGLAERLGFQELRTGDEAFDQAFVVRGNDPELVRAWLPPEVRGAMLQARAFIFAVKDGHASAEAPKLATEPAELVAAARACAALGSAGTKLAQRWMELAATTGGQMVTEQPGRLRIELPEQGVPLRIETEVLSEEVGTGTRITGRVLDPAGERFELGAPSSSRSTELAPVETDAGARLRLVSSEPAKTAARWSPALRRRIEALGPEQIVSNGEDVSVVLRGVETDEARLKEAMAVAEELARPLQTGGYR